jgi:general secretion pathway protein A
VQPPASLKALADPIYEAFYGLNDQPFAITTDPKFFYFSGSHQQAYSELLNGLRRREGILLVTGETGTGKTTLCRAVLESLGSRTFSAMILNPYMSGPEVFRVVLRDFGLVSHEEIRRGALATADVPQLVDTIEGFLRSLLTLESHAVIVLDEAQSLAPQVLDQIRLLTALEKDNRRMVQIILCGQPTLLNTLKAEPMNALNERITRRVTLTPLAAEEVEVYIQHRIAVAGGASAVSFAPGATRVVAELAHGLPRRINVLCDRALQEGRIEGANVITPDLVKRAARSVAGVHDAAPVAPSEPSPAVVARTTLPSLTLGQEEEPAARRRWPLVAAALVVLAGIGGGYGYYAYARQTMSGLAAIPPAPSAPEREPVRLAGPIPTPADDEIGALIGGRPTPPLSVAPQPSTALSSLPPPAPPAPAPQVPVPARVAIPAPPPAAEPATAPAPSSSPQLPGDPNQLN